MLVATTHVRRQCQKVVGNLIFNTELRKWQQNMKAPYCICWHLLTIPQNDLATWVSERWPLMPRNHRRLNSMLAEQEFDYKKRLAKSRICRSTWASLAFATSVKTTNAQGSMAGHAQLALKKPISNRDCTKWLKSLQGGLLGCLGHYWHNDTT